MSLSRQTDSRESSCKCNGTDRTYVGRGGSVSEEALINALDEGMIRGAGLDVLEEENPILGKNRLLGRSNVIITPHSAFYSEESMEKLQTISGANMGYVLGGRIEKAYETV